jgi:general secretion pathway protein J
VPWAPTWADGRLLPQLVSITLRSRDGADWPQLDVPLRVNPAQTGLLQRMGLRGGSIR